MQRERSRSAPLTETLILSEGCGGIRGKGNLHMDIKDAGTNTVNVTDIALDSKFEDRYELTTE